MTYHQYNERGQLTVLTHTSHKDDLYSEPSNRKYFHIYDDIGNLTERVAYDADGSLYDKESYTYDYDLRVNWIKETKTWITKAGYRSVTQFIRAISYY